MLLSPYRWYLPTTTIGYLSDFTQALYQLFCDGHTDGRKSAMKLVGLLG